MGLDLGQSQDHTALAALEVSEARDREPLHAVRHLQRWPLGTRYTDIVRDVKGLVARPQLARPALVVDGTGVGAAVVDLFAEAQLAVSALVPVVITAGGTPAADAEGRLRVPKRDLVGTLQVLLQSRRLEVAKGLAEAETLGREMAAFRVKVTAAGNEEFSAWRERDHDDLVLAVALAAWLAESAARLVRPAGDDDDDDEDEGEHLYT